MNLFFLPFVRQGLTPAANAGARANVSVSFRLESAGQPSRDISRTLALAGPGDVLAIEPRQVLRVSPAAGARDAEPDFFPLIEFDAPELPWAYSPTLPAGSRLAPWLVLVVVEADPSVRLERGAQGQSPWILHLPADRRAPGAARSGRCGHVGARADRVRDGRPRSTPRWRRIPIARCRGCWRRGACSRIAATSRRWCRRISPAASPASARIPPAIPRSSPDSSPRGAALDVPTRLPAYYAWTFRTGEAGDFESLAQRLHAVQLDPKGERTALHLSLPSGTAGLAVDWEAPLRVRGQVAQRPRRPAAAVNEIRTALRGGTNPPILGPVVLRRAVDGRARGDAYRRVGAGSEPDAGAARGGGSGRGRRARRAGRAGRGRADAARRVHEGPARGTPAAAGHGVRQPGGACGWRPRR